METLRWEQTKLILLDQTKLPLEESYISCTHWQDVRHAISILAVRGAPAIGVAAAYGVVLAAQESARIHTDGRSLYEALLPSCASLDASRPTAVNLHWALERMLACSRNHLCGSSLSMVQALESLAREIQAEDVRINTAMAHHGAAELAKAGKPLTILTHCNAGALATAGVGTALGVIRALHQQGLVHMVYADETRPLLQGARLTAFELQKDGIPVTLITDNMAAWVMKTKGVDAVIVGADRITGNGDTANKIGTYGVAILAKEHHIPFFVAAPISTFDIKKKTGDEIPIEERDHDEVRKFRSEATALPDTAVFNPAFDVTPHRYISGIFTEKGTILHPNTEGISHFMMNL
ncbi:MAG: S-methyl-5-thioribose-1-phosphate isomerase [Megasphaera sp.]|jgi:methylthioribose-1-phosphate isomerase|nr:S-methyl-5-thioribose-1-phosphate isomerase [Megasphaera sp.]